MNATDDFRGEIAIAMTFDDSWVPHFATCAASLAASRGRESVRIFILSGPSLSSQSFRKMRDFVRDLGMDVESLTITEDQYASLPPKLLYSQINWYRILLPELLPELDRILYLDADTLVMQSLAPVFEVELGNSLLAAVGVRAVDGRHGRGLGLDSNAPYLNDGVMMMNLEAMRADNVGARAIAFGNERDLVFAEQDALNVIAQGRWDLLHPRWNAMSHLWLMPHQVDPTYSRLDQESARVSPGIVHFEGFQTVKPWYYRSVHPLRFLYRDIRATTPWPLERLERKSITGAVLRTLPFRSQNAITRVKARLNERLTRN